MDHLMSGVPEKPDDIELERVRAQEILSAVIDSMDELVFVVDMKNSRILYANKAVYDILGENVIGEKCYTAMFRRNSVCGDCPRSEMLADGNVPSAVAIREMRSPVTTCWYWIKSRIITWHDNRHVQLCCANDITARKRAEQKLITLVQTDKMTGAYSRDYGLRLLNDALIKTYAGEETITVCYMDVDGLKSVNDRFGHAEGDNLLIKIAEVIKRSTRSTDVFVRMGGDEFLLVLRDTPLSGARKVMDTVNRRLDEINESKMSPYEFSLSMGFCEVRPSTSESVDAILRKADMEMYASKLERKKTR